MIKISKNKKRAKKFGAVGEINMNNLDNIQEKIVTSDSSKILVVAGSGSGKTRVLTERIKYLLNKGVDPKGIVAITFTNAAADEMRERLGEIANGVYIGTIHGYANRLLLIGGLETRQYIEEENFDKFFFTIKKHPEVISHVEYLLVDEFQDIDDNQYNFLMNMIKPDNFFLVGDDWQNIYSWRGSNVQYFLTLAYDPKVTVYKMENNYRTGYNIITFAMGFLKPVKEKIKKKVIPKNKNLGILIERDNIDIPYIVSEILKDKDFGNWFILTRTNSQIEDVQRSLKNYKIPSDTFKKSDLSTNELKNKMKENTVKVLTVHSAKGLENINVAVIGVNPVYDEERRVAYVAATRAKNKLIWCYKNKTSHKKKVRTFNWE